MFKCEDCGGDSFEVINVDPENEILYLQCKTCGNEMDLEDYSNPLEKVQGLNKLLESYEHSCRMDEIIDIVL